jgi:hypothetical protein
MLFGFTLSGYEFEADLEEMELSGGKTTRDNMKEDDAGSASAEA